MFAMKDNFQVQVFKMTLIVFKIVLLLLKKYAIFNSVMRQWVSSDVFLEIKFYLQSMHRLELMGKVFFKI